VLADRALVGRSVAFRGDTVTLVSHAVTLVSHGVAPGCRAVALQDLLSIQCGAPRITRTLGRVGCPVALRGDTVTFSGCTLAFVGGFVAVRRLLSILSGALTVTRTLGSVTDCLLVPADGALVGGPVAFSGDPVTLSGRALAFVSRVVACVGLLSILCGAPRITRTFPSVAGCLVAFPRDSVTLVGASVTPSGDPVTFRGDFVTLVGHTLAPRCGVVVFIDLLSILCGALVGHTVAFPGDTVTAVGRTVTAVGRTVALVSHDVVLVDGQLLLRRRHGWLLWSLARPCAKQTQTLAQPPLPHHQRSYRRVTTRASGLRALDIRYSSNSDGNNGGTSSQRLNSLSFETTIGMPSAEHEPCRFLGRIHQTAPRPQWS
jgi:hypothetical protein